MATSQEAYMTKRKVCHGWTDDKGKKHPCSKKTLTFNYRCDECWRKMGRNIYEDNRIVCEEDWI